MNVTHISYIKFREYGNIHTHTHNYKVSIEHQDRVVRYYLLTINHGSNVMGSTYDLRCLHAYNTFTQNVKHK